MSQYTRLPNSSSTNPSIGTNGSTAPTSSTEVGGIGPDGHLHALSTDNTGALNVNLSTTSIEIGKVDQGTPNNDANAWPIRITDGTHDALVTVAGALRVDGSAVTQPVSISASVSVTQGTSPWVVSLASTTITGTVAVTQSTSPWVVSGTVAVSNFPATQPVSGTVAVTQSTSPWVVSGTVTANAGTGTFAISAASLPLPTGASTSAKQPALGTAGSASSDVITVQGIASMTALKVDGSAVTQPISGSVSVSNFPATQPVSGTVAVTQSTSPWVVSLTSTTITGTVAVTQSTSPWVSNISQFGGSNVVTGTGTSGAGIPRVTVSSDSTVTANAGTGTFTTSETTSGTSTLTNVSGSASSVSLLASNANRKNATFFNDSTATLYLKFGATASTTSYTVQLTSLAYYELPVGKIYTGAIDGIWSAANGAARITELT